MHAREVRRRPVESQDGVWGCDFCADSDNRDFGHLDQVLGNDGGVALLRCPLCQVIYLPSDDGHNTFARLPLEQAFAVLPESEWHVIPGDA
jgi:hypothetical protein